MVSRKRFTGFVLKSVDKEETITRIAGEFKQILKPYYSSGRITKEEYKEIMRKAVPQVRVGFFIIVRISFSKFYAFCS
jgi:hypothetical protein